jgi:hypothetical protein
MRLDGAVPPLLVMGAALLLVAWRQGYLGGRGRVAPRIDAAIVGLLLVVMACLEWQMGRPLTYRHGPVRLWSGNIRSDQNSQQIADPYTFTHIVHGAAFYGLTQIAMGPASIGLRTIAAVALEASWEAYENTDTVVRRYRVATISRGYFGDSLINSIFDVVACVFGFFLTRRLPRNVTLAWVIAVEVMLAFWIRDNLTLNLVMLLHPFAFIRRWQMGF